jgi:hypothetical protein
VIFLELLAIYVVGACTLARIATKVRGRRIAWIFAFLVGCGAAYSMGFALEILLRQITGAIPGGQPWPVVTWAVLGMTGFVIAATANPNGWLAAVPCGVFAALELATGVIEHGVEPAADAAIYTGLILIFVAIVLVRVVPQTRLENANPLWPAVPALWLLGLAAPAAYLYGIIELLSAGEILKAIGAASIFPVGIIYGFGRFFGWW